MKKYIRTYFSICLIALFFSGTLKAQLPAAKPISPAKVLIVYNASDGDSNHNGIPDSKELALYYKDKRGVPDSNLLGLTIRQNEGYYYKSGWKKFWAEMVLPIKNKIKTLGDTSIYYILMCDRLPYYLYDDSTIGSGLIAGRSIDNALACINDIGNKNAPNYQAYWYTNPLYETTVTKGKDIGSFNHKIKLNGHNIYLVSRLVSPSLEMDENLVDMALYGEKYIYNAKGYYKGISYADNHAPDDAATLKGYPYAVSTYSDFDKNAGYIYKFYQKKGLAYKYEDTYVSIGDSGATYSDTTSALKAPNAMLYGGWYNYGRYNNVWTWIPGSVACDLNSNSSQGIRAAVNYSFLSGAIQNGLTCGSGVLFEPYLNGHSQPDVLLYYLLNGYNFIESVYHAEPGLFWQGEPVGDPLYNPFKAGKTAVKDTTMQPVRISIEYMSKTHLKIHADLNCRPEAPEVIKLRIVYGPGISGSTDTIPFSKLYMAHHYINMDSLKTGRYHFTLCAIDPSGNTWCSKPYWFNADSASDNVIQAAFTASDSAICPGSQVSFENISSGARNYLWTINGKVVDSAENTKLTFTTAGKYAVGLKAAGKDSIVKYITVGISKPIISRSGNTLRADSGMASYQWFYNGLPIAGADSFKYRLDSTGSYRVLESNTLGCSDTSAPIMYLVTAISEIKVVSLFEVFPNPFSEETRIQYNLLKAGSVTLDVCDLLGRKLETFSSTTQTTTGMHEFIFRAPQAGIYFVRLKAGGETAIRKVIRIE